MNSKWIWIGAATVVLGGMIWVLVVMLFGSISNELFDGLNAEAQVQLTHICDLEKSYLEQHGTYEADLETIGFYQSEDDGAKFVYEVGLADSSRFIARAFAREDYDLDKQQLTWEVRPDCVPRKIEDD
jgi:type IV pilus assembly protein PilE